MDKNQKLARREPGKAAPAGQRPTAQQPGKRHVTPPPQQGKAETQRRAREEFLVRRAGGEGDRPRP
jgi:hypothetical protein